MNNKKVILNPILRIWLAIFAIIIFISVLSAFNGERWHFNKTVDYFKAATGNVTTHELYTPAKIFFAMIFSFAPPLLWLLVVNKRKLMAVTHGVIPLIFFLLSIVFFFLKPEVIPGGETTTYRYGAHSLYYEKIRWQKMSADNYISTKSEYKTFLEYKDPRGYREPENIKNAYVCETERETIFFTLVINKTWFPDDYPNIIDAHCTQIKDIRSLSEYTLSSARWFPI